jgi:cyclic pyranopterin phosphate synthase
LQDLRISVTDHCNFRCVYCMPKSLFGTRHRFLAPERLLSFPQIVRLARLFAQLGVRKIRLTGGEPLLRPNLEELVAGLADIPGIRDIAMTTNGSALTAAKAAALKTAGLSRVTVSLDSLRDETFQAMNDVGFPLARVLAAIDHAQASGLPVKLNSVVRRGLNDEDILPLAEHFRGTGHVLRFIEYMDVGNLNGWRPEDVVPASEIVSRIDKRWPLEPLGPTRYGEVASRYRYRDGQGEIGVISSVSHPFCRSCTRARLSPEGRLYTCLFATSGADLRPLLESDAADGELLDLIGTVWQRREDRYSELRSLLRARQGGEKVEMFHIGG